MRNDKQGNCESQFFKSFGMTDMGMKPRSHDYYADAITITPTPLSYNTKVFFQPHEPAVFSVIRKCK